MATSFTIVWANNYFETSVPTVAAAARQQGADVVGTHVFRVTPEIGKWMNMPAAVTIRGKTVSRADVEQQAQRFRYIGGGVWEVSK